MPVDVLKMDQHFLANVEHDPARQAHVPGGAAARLQPGPAGDRRGRHQRRRPRPAARHGPPLPAGLRLLPPARGRPARRRRLAGPARRARAVAAGRDAPLSRRSCRRDRLRELPRSVRWTVPLALLGLALTVPFSAPDGTGMQWDELVLGCVAACDRLAAVLRLRPGHGAAGRAARGSLWASAALLFMVAQWLEAAFPGPGVRRLRRRQGPPVRRRRARRWSPAGCSPGGSPAPAGRPWSSTALIITVALLVVTEVLRTPLVNPAGRARATCARSCSPTAATPRSCSAAPAPCAPSRPRRCAARSRVMIGAVAAQAAAAWLRGDGDRRAHRALDRRLRRRRRR